MNLIPEEQEQVEEIFRYIGERFSYSPFYDRVRREFEEYRERIEHMDMDALEELIERTIYIFSDECEKLIDEYCDENGIGEEVRQTTYDFVERRTQEYSERGRRLREHIAELAENYGSFIEEAERILQSLGEILERRPERSSIPLN
jgi:response regulator RpfG family c-di-GMP phosphodiesterase